MNIFKYTKLAITIGIILTEFDIKVIKKTMIERVK